MAKKINIKKVDELFDVDCCKNCYFYRGDESNGFSCKSSPPVVIYNKDDSDGSVDILYSFPNVPEYEWCGHFKRKVH